ncbi:IS3 family transposase [Aquitalea sp. LB_tupeE]|nr:IS3 family transposase [Aquitalea sp. LB_tupeE]
MLGHIKQAWLKSSGAYGYRKVHEDMQAQGECCGKHHVLRLTKQKRLRSEMGYHRRPGHYSGHPAVVAPNHVQRQLPWDDMNRACPTDTTYIYRHEGGAGRGAGPVPDNLKREAVEQVLACTPLRHVAQAFEITESLLDMWKRIFQEADRAAKRPY